MQNAFFKLFWFDFDRCFCADREKRPFARSFVVEQILNLFFFWPLQAFKVMSYFSFHWCPIVRETWPHSPYSHTLRRVALPRWRKIGLEWSAFHRKEWPRYRVRYKSDATSIRGTWPLSTDRQNWSRLGTFLTFSFHKLSLSNWNFLSIFLGWLEWPARFWEVQEVGNVVKISIQQRWASENKHHRNPLQNHHYADLWAKRPKEMVSGYCKVTNFRTVFIFVHFVLLKKYEI